MSAETITIAVGVASILLSFFGGFAWMIHRMDARFDRSDARISSVERELVEVKIGLARLEGPPRRLVTSG